MLPKPREAKPFTGAANRLRLGPLLGRMNKLLSYLIQNKRRIAKCLYLAAALIENIPDSPYRQLKKASVRVISPQRRGKRSAHK
jgi:hypothetical protein